MYLKRSAHRPLNAAVATLSSNTDAVSQVGQMVGKTCSIHIVCQFPVKTGNVSRNSSQVLETTFWSTLRGIACVLSDSDSPHSGETHLERE